jgi:hypothetical protein
MVYIRQRTLDCPSPSANLLPISLNESSTQPFIESLDLGTLGLPESIPFTFLLDGFFVEPGPEPHNIKLFYPFHGLTYLQCRVLALLRVRDVIILGFRDVKTVSIPHVNDFRDDSPAKTTNQQRADVLLNAINLS